MLLGGWGLGIVLLPFIAPFAWWISEGPKQILMYCWQYMLRAEIAQEKVNRVKMALINYSIM